MLGGAGACGRFGVRLLHCSLCIPRVSLLLSAGLCVPAQVRPPSVPVRFVCCCKHHVCKLQSLGRGFSSHTHLFLLLKTHRCSPQPFWNSFHAHNKGEEVFIFFLALPRISGSGYCCLTGQLNEDVFQRWHIKDIDHWDKLLLDSFLWIPLSRLCSKQQRSHITTKNQQGG